MPAGLALTLAYLFIAWLFLNDKRPRGATSRGLIVPAIFLFIISSRPVTFWFGWGGSTGGASYGATSGDLEGNSAEAMIMTLIIIAGLVVLFSRKVNIQAILSQNKIIVALYVYFLVSTSWSEFSFVSFKRWTKDFGLAAMVLIVLTEPQPLVAVRTLFVRCSYFLFPLSVVFIKWYPHIGRNQTVAGDNMFTGITTQKNSLGAVVWIFSLMLIWDALEILKEPKNSQRTKQIGIRVGLLIMGGWLLLICASSTSLIVLCLGLCVLAATKRLARMRNPRFVVATCVGILVLAAVIDKQFDVKTSIILAMGKKPTLTGRTEIWEKVLRQPTNPLLGCGYESFWNSKLGLAALDEIEYNIKSTHNGYIEMYVDGGAVCLILLTIMLCIGTARVFNRMLTGSLWGRFSFTFWVCILTHNYSESEIFRLSPMWFTMLLITMEVPPSMSSAVIEEGQTRQTEFPIYAEA